MKRLFLLAVFAGLLVLTGCSLGSSSSSEAQSSASGKKTEPASTTQTVSSSEKTSKTTIPTVFFHGYQGTVNSFGHLISRLEAQGLAQKELLLTVNPDGTIQTEGALTGKADNPIVQVLFSDNQNNEWNQSEWIKAVLQYLKQTYGTTEVQLVGHSMGGVSSLRYLGNYGSDASLPTVTRFAALGAPFNDFVDTSSSQTITDELQNGPAEHSSRYEDYRSMIGNVPTALSALLIGGQQSDTDLSDGTVPLSSALAVAALLTQHGNSVTTKIIQGTTHSGLHENTEVDQLLAAFLWGE